MSRRRRFVAVVTALVLLLVVPLLVFRWGALALLRGKDTLVVYVYGPGDPEYIGNLEYFVRHGIPEDDPFRDYIVLVQYDQHEQRLTLPRLPRPARYIFHRNACFEWGAVGWLFASDEVDWYRYKHYVIVTSAVRGPFMPTYLSSKMHWTHAFTSKLNDHVKLVGSTISCQGAALGADATGPWRHNPHAPSSAIALDRVGMQLLIEDGTVLLCHDTPWAARYNSEVGAAAAVLSAGFNIDSLMIRYQGVDWRDTANWGCNALWDPADGDYGNDGVSISPMEVLFVRVCTALLQHEQPAAVQAAKYASWAAADDTQASAAVDAGAASAPAAVLLQDRSTSALPGLHGVAVNTTARVLANEYKTRISRYKLARILLDLVRGMACFDVDYFMERNPDLRRFATNPSLVWRFFVYMGQFEDRPFRYKCDLDYNRFGTPAF